jgi:hypothetical protein
MTNGELLKLSLKLTGLVTGTAFFTIVMANVLFGFFYDKWVLMVTLKELFSVYAFLVLICCIISIILLVIALYWTVKAEVIRQYFDSGKSNHAKRLDEVTASLTNVSASMKSHVADLKTQLSDQFDSSSGILLSQVSSLTTASQTISDETGVLAKQVQASLNALNAGNLISYPSDYGRILIEHISNPNPANQISLVGTMAGFNFTIGKALSSYIFLVKNFTKLNIFTTARVDGGEDHDTIIYAAFMIISTIRGFLTESAKPDAGAVRRIAVEVGYMKRDLFSAAIMIAEKECIVLPTLKNSALKKVVEVAGTPLLGLRYRNDGALGREVFLRLQEVLSEHETQYLTARGRGKSKTAPEIWEVTTSVDGSCKVTVKAPRWRIHENKFDSLSDVGEVDHVNTVEISDGTIADAIETLSKHIAHILGTPGAGIEFGKLLAAVQDAPAKPEFAFDCQ